MILKQAERVVIKIGSSLVTNQGKGLDQKRLSSIAKQIAYLKSEGENSCSSFIWCYSRGDATSELE